MGDIIHSAYTVIPCPKCRGNPGDAGCETCKNLGQVRILIDFLAIFPPEG